MKTPTPSALTLACLVAFGGAVCGAQAQGLGLRPGNARSGITDIMNNPQRGIAPAEPAAAAPVQGQRAAEFIVALVNSEPITNTEVQTRVNRILAENAEARRAPIGELARLVLERIILERAQLQLAKENGIRVDDLTVDQAEETVARQNQVSREELRRRVAAEGMSWNEFRNDLRNQLLLTRLREREVNARVRISDVEIEQYLRD